MVNDDSKVPPDQQASQEHPLIFASRPERIMDALRVIGWFSPIEVEGLKQRAQEWEERAFRAEKQKEEWELFCRKCEDVIRRVELIAEAINNNSVTEGSPGPLYDAGFAAASKISADLVKRALSGES